MEAPRYSLAAFTIKLSPSTIELLQTQSRDKRMSTTGYDLVWESKGIAWQGRPWSAQSGKTGRIVLSAWDNLEAAKSEVRYVGDQDVLRCIPGDWVHEPKGKKYLEHCRALLASGEAAEVIFVRGERHDAARSKVKRAWVDTSKYFVRITRVEPDGTVEGVFEGQ